MKSEAIGEVFNVPQNAGQRWTACSTLTRSMSPSWSPTGVLIETLQTALVSVGEDEMLLEHWQCAEQCGQVGTASWMTKGEHDE